MLPKLFLFAFLTAELNTSESVTPLKKDLPQVLVCRKDRGSGMLVGLTISGCRTLERKVTLKLIGAMFPT